MEGKLASFGGAYLELVSFDCGDLRHAAMPRERRRDKLEATRHLCMELLSKLLYAAAHPCSVQTMVRLKLQRSSCMLDLIRIIALRIS